VILVQAVVSVSEGGVIMAGKAVPNMKGVRVFPPAPKGCGGSGFLDSAIS